MIGGGREGLERLTRLAHATLDVEMWRDVGRRARARSWARHLALRLRVARPRRARNARVARTGGCVRAWLPCRGVGGLSVVIIVVIGGVVSVAQRVAYAPQAGLLLDAWTAKSARGGGMGGQWVGRSKRGRRVWMWTGVDARGRWTTRGRVLARGNVGRRCRVSVGTGGRWGGAVRRARTWSCRGSSCSPHSRWLCTRGRCHSAGAWAWWSARVEHRHGACRRPRAARRVDSEEPCWPGYWWRLLDGCAARG